MFGFDDDELLLVFLDDFGLTSLHRPDGELRTNSKISGRERAMVTVSRDGSLAACSPDSPSGVAIWRLPQLTATQRFPYRPHMVMFPSKSHCARPCTEGLVRYRVERGIQLPARLDRFPDDDSDYLAFDEGPWRRLPALELGPAELRTRVSLRISHDGTLITQEGGELVCATVDDGGGVEPLWRRDIRVPKGAIVDAYADARRCVLVLREGRRSTVVEWAQAPAGADERHFEVESLGPPVVAGPYLAYQPQADRVCRTKLETGEREEFSLEIDARALDLPTTGPGWIFAAPRGALLFLCAHKESLLDLERGVEISRELPPEHFEVRRTHIEFHELCPRYGASRQPKSREAFARACSSPDPKWARWRAWIRERGLYELTAMFED